MYTEAGAAFRVKYCKKVMAIQKRRTGLASCYYHTGKFSAAIIIYEQLQNQLSARRQYPVCKMPDKRKFFTGSGAIYQKVIAANPSFKDEEIDGYLRIAFSCRFWHHRGEEDFDTEDSMYFMEKPKVKVC